jgi:hypothetical protein
LYIINQVKLLLPGNIDKLKIRIYETYDDYAEAEINLNKQE